MQIANTQTIMRRRWLHCRLLDHTIDVIEDLAPLNIELTGDCLCNVSNGKNGDRCSRSGGGMLFRSPSHSAARGPLFDLVRSAWQRMIKTRYGSMVSIPTIPSPALTPPSLDATDATPFSTNL